MWLVSQVRHGGWDCRDWVFGQCLNRRILWTFLTMSEPHLHHAVLLSRPLTKFRISNWMMMSHRSLEMYDGRSYTGCRTSCCITWMVQVTRGMSAVSAWGMRLLHHWVVFLIKTQWSYIVVTKQRHGGQDCWVQVSGQCIHKRWTLFTLNKPQLPDDMFQSGHLSKVEGP
jgi:hypothetical protein